MNNHKTFVEFMLLAGSSIGAQIINLVTIPIVASFFMPESFGEYSFIFTLSTITAIIISGSLSLAIATTNTKRKSQLLATEIFVISSICSITIIITLIAIHLLKSISLTTTIGIMAMGWIIATTQIASAYAIRTKRSKIVASTSIIKALIGPIVSISLLLYFEESAIILLIGYSLAELVPCIIIQLSASLINKKNIQLVVRSKFKLIRSQAKQITQFMPSQLIAMATNFMPMLTLRELAAPVVLGQFSMTLRVLAAPANAIVGAAKPLYWNFAKYSDNEIHFKNAAKVFLIANGIGIAISSILTIYQIEVFNKMLGEKWSGADQILPFMFLWIMSSLGRALSTEILRKHNKEIQILKNELIGFAIKTALCFLYQIIDRNAVEFVIVWLTISYIFNTLTGIIDIIKIKANPDQ